MILATVLGIGLATGIYTTPSWQAASMISPGSLLATAFSPLHSFGNFCASVLVLGMVSNNIPCTYSAGLNFQMLGSYGPRLPRPILTTLEVIICTATAIAGHQYLSVILENFLPLMSYWIVVWLGICLEEEWVFKRGRRAVYEWRDWDRVDGLPVGLAAGVTFGLGCLGGVLGMVCQSLSVSLSLSPSLVDCLPISLFTQLCLVGYS